MIKEDTMKDSSTAWAIKAHIPGHAFPCFLGVFYFVSDLHVSQDGMRVALFRTRKQARDMIRSRESMRRVFLFIRAVKVVVTIREIE